MEHKKRNDRLLIGALLLLAAVCLAGARLVRRPSDGIAQVASCLLYTSDAADD